MPDLLSKFSRYLITGGTAALVDIAGFALLMSMSAGVVFASGVSFCLAALVNFTLTSRIVFGQVSRSNRFVLFFGAALVGLMVNVTVTMAGVDWLHLPPVAAKMLGIAVALLINFTLNLRLVFRVEAHHGSPPTARIQTHGDAGSLPSSGTLSLSSKPQVAPQPKLP